jgi:rhamnogalacturonyl hydrolase YesR
LEPVNYTQGVALSGRLRLGQLEGSGAHLEDVQAVVEPYVSGQKDIFPPDRVSTAGICGLLWASEVFRLTSEGRYLDLLLEVMSRYQPGEGDSPPTPSDPDHRTEDMFMNACMLSRTGHLTGEGRYFDMAASALKAPRIQQEDGLFWHSLSAPYYWGRGNGFAALGYAEALTYLPREHPDRPLLIERHRKHLESLRRYQSPWGTYHQVINNPGSYQEFTSTCMIGYATARGLRLGWLDHSFRESMERAWQAVLERIDDDGGLVDCCTNTGVQQSLQDYFDRPAIFGHDDRGGAMALWFATEYIQLSSQQSIII